MRTFQIPHEFQRMAVLENLVMMPPGQAGEKVLASWFRWGKVKSQERTIRR